VEEGGASGKVKSPSWQIAQTIVMLAHNLGMEVIAEGVETTGQLRQLRSLNCQYGQGYLFSRPEAASTAGALESVRTLDCSYGVERQLEDLPGLVQ